MLIIEVKDNRAHKTKRIGIVRKTEWGTKRHVYHITVGARTATVQGPDRFGLPWILTLPNGKKLELFSRHDAFRYLTEKGI